MSNRLGWICPKCNKSLSPDTKECNCGTYTTYPAVYTPVKTYTTDCSCPVGQPCLNAYCPRKVTCSYVKIKPTLSTGRLIKEEEYPKY